jgi:outer membrane protein
MIRKNFFSLLVAVLTLTGAAQAQTATKYGHMNLGNLLESLPETKKANEDLKAFTDKLSAKDDTLTRNFQAKVAKFQEDYQAGRLTPVQAQTLQSELEKEQQSIQEFEQQAQQQVAAKREELLKPILTKVDDAVKKVAKASGYLMVFDTSSGVMLFASDTDDVTPLVKKELGIQ